jgi:hypothetical protein
MKTALSLLVIFLTIYHSSAQLSLGFKLGHVKAWEKYDDIGMPDDAKIHVNGIQASAMLTLPLSHSISFSIEPGYAQRGAACYPRFVSDQRDTRFRFNYLELPVLIAFHPTLSKTRFGLTGKAGFGGAYIIRATQQTTFSDFVDSTIEKVDFGEEDWINRFDFGMYGGVGVTYSTGKVKLIAEVMHYHGVIDVDENNTTENRSMQYAIGYMFSF